MQALHDFIQRFNTDINIACEDMTCAISEGCNPALCTKPVWSNKPDFSIDHMMAHKDTVMIPADLPGEPGDKAAIITSYSQLITVYCCIMYSIIHYFDE